MRFEKILKAFKGPHAAHYGCRSALVSSLQAPSIEGHVVGSARAFDHP
jgi:hypothetical protein